MELTCCSADFMLASSWMTTADIKSFSLRRYCTIMLSTSCLICDVYQMIRSPTCTVREKVKRGSMGNHQWLVTFTGLLFGQVSQEVSCLLACEVDHVLSMPVHVECATREKPAMLTLVLVARLLDLCCTPAG